MNDNYKHIPSNVTTSIGVLKGYIKEYSAKITNLDSKITEIESSSSWIDVAVKTAFINTCRSYMKLYTKIIEVLQKYVSYLEQKSGEGASLENSFTRVISNERK